MKKSIVILVGASLLMASCGTYSETGALVGGNFGHLLGSSIGGMSGGWRGAHAGSLIGTLGGVIVGAAVGAAIDDAKNKSYDQRGYDDQAPVRNRQTYDDRIEMEP